MITAASGTIRHTCTAITDPIARPGLPSQIMCSPGSSTPTCCRIQSSGRQQRVEHEHPRDGADGRRRRPRQEHEEADQPLAAEVGGEDHGQHVGQHDRDRHRDAGEHERVPERLAEHRVVEDARGSSGARRSRSSGSPADTSLKLNAMARKNGNGHQRDDVDERGQQHRPGRGDPRCRPADRGGRVVIVRSCTGSRARSVVGSKKRRSSPRRTNGVGRAVVDRGEHRGRQAHDHRRRLAEPGRHAVQVAVAGQVLDAVDGEVERDVPVGAAPEHRRRERLLRPEADDGVVARDQVHRWRAEERGDERVGRAAGRRPGAVRSGGPRRRTSPRCGRPCPSPRPGRG